MGVSNGFTPGYDAVDSTGGIRYVTMQLLIQHGGDHVEEGNMEFSWGKLFDKVGEPTPMTPRDWAWSTLRSVTEHRAPQIPRPQQLLSIYQCLYASEHRTSESAFGFFIYLDTRNANPTQPNPTPCPTMAQTGRDEGLLEELAEGADRFGATRVQGSGDVAEA